MRGYGLLAWCRAAAPGYRWPTLLLGPRRPRPRHRQDGQPDPDQPPLATAILCDLHVAPPKSLWSCDVIPSSPRHRAETLGLRPRSVNRNSHAGRVRRHTRRRQRASRADTTWEIGRCESLRWSPLPRTPRGRSPPRPIPRETLGDRHEASNPDRLGHPDRRGRWIGPSADAPGRQAEVFSRHVVVAQEGHAAEAGREALRAGGNAVDAAIATAFALAVTLPEAGNLGGGGFLVAYLPDRKEVVTVDFREMAPRSAIADDVPRAPTASRARATGPGPGRPACRGRSAAWPLAHARWGKRPWAELVRPAVRLAREGFPISEDLAALAQPPARPRPRETNDERPTPKRPAARDDFGRLGDYPETVAALGKPDGSPWHAGDRLVQPDLAATLERIAAGGRRRVLHRPDRRADRRATCEQHGGFITRDDLKSYQAKVRPPVHTTFRGFDVYGAGPPSSGGVTVCLMLNILERYDLKADGRDSPRTLHRVTEAMRRAFFVRATQLADPDFVPVPVAELTSQVVRRRRWPGRSATAPPPAPSSPRSRSSRPRGTTRPTSRPSTTPAAPSALTYTLEDSYGAKCVVAGAGFLLNNEMGDFNLIPGRTDVRGWIGTPANQIAARASGCSARRRRPSCSRTAGCGVVTGSPGGPDDPEHDALGRAQRPGVRARPARRRRRPADPPPVVPRRPEPRGTRLADGHARGPRRPGTPRADDRTPGECQHDRRGARRGRTAAADSRRARPLAGRPRGPRATDPGRPVAGVPPSRPRPGRKIRRAVGTRSRPAP